MANVASHCMQHQACVSNLVQPLDVLPANAPWLRIPTAQHSWPRCSNPLRSSLTSQRPVRWAVYSTISQGSPQHPASLQSNSSGNNANPIASSTDLSQPPPAGSQVEANTKTNSEGLVDGGDGGSGSGHPGRGTGGGGEPERDKPIGMAGKSKYPVWLRVVLTLAAILYLFARRRWHVERQERELEYRTAKEQYEKDEESWHKFVEEYSARQQK